MNVALIGGTGRTGQLVLAELLRRGHTVSVLARDPAKLGEQAASVRVVTGSATDPTVITELLTGADAVVSALGPTAKESDLHTRTARLLVERMPQLGVTRFIGVSGAAIDVPGDAKGTRDRLISTLIRTAGGAASKDKQAEYRVFAGSNLDWTLVRPPRLLDSPATGHASHDARTPGHWSVPRADLASVMVDVLEQGLYVRQAPFVWAK
jgi:putative NADH-flavin reductase